MTERQSQLLATELLRANLMFDLWKKHEDEVPKKYPKLEFNRAVLLLPSINYLFIGIAFLDSIIEFMRKKSIPFPESINKDVKQIGQKLHKFRNAIFHINDDFLDEQQIALFDIPNSLPTVGKIHGELQAHFVELLRQRKQ